jgi:hypothetical protein
MNIVRDGKIKSLRKQGKKDTCTYAGLDYISLCDYELRDVTPSYDEYYNAYNSYIKNGISFAFPKDKLDVIVPHYLDPYSEAMKTMGLVWDISNSDKRYSDFFDEVQVKDEISLDKALYLTFPTRHFFLSNALFTKNTKSYSLEKKIYEINLILDYFNYSRDIYDIDTQIKLDEEGIKKLIYKK